MIGKKAEGRIVKDRSHLDYLRVFASKQNVIGMELSKIKFPEGIEANIVQVRRGDSDLIAGPDVTVELGDRIGLLCDRQHFEALRKFFGGFNSQYYRIQLYRFGNRNGSWSFCQHHSNSNSRSWNIETRNPGWRTHRFFDSW